MEAVETVKYLMFSVSFYTSYFKVIKMKIGRKENIFSLSLLQVPILNPGTDKQRQPECTSLNSCISA